MELSFRIKFSLGRKFSGYEFPAISNWRNVVCQLKNNTAENRTFRKNINRMKVLVAGQQLTQESPFDVAKQYNGELDVELKELENKLKAFEKQHNLILKYNSEGCEEELGCIIFMEDVNLLAS
ncbi:hypothetical protein AAIP31_002267 [Flavobacterium psychrophilum]